MNVLIACEESQRVCKEFRKKGHNAFSCDIVECSGGKPEWHIKDDVIPLLNINNKDTWTTIKTCDGKLHDINKWDIIIAFPPCTDLCVSGARHFARKKADGTQQKSIDFFMQFVNADCEKIAIENPIGIMSKEYRKPDQIIQPWWYGDGVGKSTCLWLKGLPLLPQEITEKPETEYFVYPNGKRMEKWIYDALSKGGKDRAKIRSKTFPQVARAMAQYWG